MRRLLNRLLRRRPPAIRSITLTRASANFPAGTRLKIRRYR